MIADAMKAMKKVGNEGVITIDEAKTAETELSTSSKGDLVRRLFDLRCELPHCLSVSPHNAKSRVPTSPEWETQDFVVQFRFTQFFTNGSSSQCARAVTRSKTGNLGFGGGFPNATTWRPE